MDASNLPFQDNSIDSVFLLNVLPRLKNPKKTFEDIQRILKTDGEFVVTTPYLNNLVARNPNDLYIHSRNELEELFRNAGFSANFQYVTADSSAIEIHNKKKKLARVPFARNLRRIIPVRISERALRVGASSKALTQNNFYLSENPSDRAIDIMAIAINKFN